MENVEIRKKIREAGLRHWQVARAVGCGETTFCHWLREELPADKRDMILKAIEALKGGKSHGKASNH